MILQHIHCCQSQKLRNPPFTGMQGWCQPNMMWHSCSTDLQHYTQSQLATRHLRDERALVVLLARCNTHGNPQCHAANDDLNPPRAHGATDHGYTSCADPKHWYRVCHREPQARCTPSFVLLSSAEDMLTREDAMQRLVEGLGKRAFVKQALLPRRVCDRIIWTGRTAVCVAQVFSLLLLGS